MPKRGFIIVCSLIVLTFAVTVEAQNTVNCFDGFSVCTGAPTTATLDDCCDHSVDPPGLAYSVPGFEECFECPISELQCTIQTIC